jgi:hypothetical protein
MAHNEAHNALVRDALQELALAGYTCWPTNTGAFKTDHGTFIKYGKKGGGDITGILAPHGRYFEAEAKTGAGRQSEAQINHQKYVVERNGGLYILFRSVPELLAALRAATT